MCMLQEILIKVTGVHILFGLIFLCFNFSVIYCLMVYVYKVGKI